MLAITSSYRSCVVAATAIAAVAFGSSSALARCAYVSSWDGAPMYWCNPHKAELGKDCNDTIRTVYDKDYFYVLWEESFLAPPMLYLRNRYNRRELGWIYKDQLTIDDSPKCYSKAVAKKRARKR
jgi:hypothetical protein